jgi:uncharacterized protein YndB with AHSA1/START domain
MADDGPMFRLEQRLKADPDRRLVMTRRFAASPARVFDAWTNPKRAGRWLFTGPDSEAHTTQMDLRVGGAWRIMDKRGGTQYVALGEYLEIDPPRRLVFSFGMPQFSPEFDCVIVELAPDGDGCIMTMTQEGIAPEHKAPTEHGWNLMFNGLESLMEDAA